MLTDAIQLVLGPPDVAYGVRSKPTQTFLLEYRLDYFLGLVGQQRLADTGAVHAHPATGLGEQALRVRSRCLLDVHRLGPIHHGEVGRLTAQLYQLL